MARQAARPHRSHRVTVRQAGRTLLLCCFAYMIAFMWMQFLSAWVVQHITESTRCDAAFRLCFHCLSSPNNAPFLVVLRRLQAGPAHRLLPDWPVRRRPVHRQAGLAPDETAILLTPSLHHY